MSAKRILIAPLDWGLGHATRCIPIIRYVHQLGHTPIIASDGRPGELLRTEFPHLEFHKLKGYNIEYPTGAGMAWKMFRSAPNIFKVIKWEEQEIGRLVDELKLDAVISDNRFGLHTPKVPCVYMTHQVMIKAPFAQPLLHWMHMRYAKEFDQCWVPDLAESPGLSGDLGHHFQLPENGSFIGPLSRFEKMEVEKSLDLVCVISGPEPQRTRFENLILEQLEQFRGTALVIAGTPEVKEQRMDLMRHRIVPHLSADELQLAISKSRVVMSRSGYSTIMDLSVTGGKAIFVPTPGQTEQQYLARMFDRNKIHLFQDQNKLNIEEALKKVKDYRGFEARPCNEFKAAVDSLVEGL